MLKYILKYGVTAVVGAILSWATKWIRDQREKQQVAQDAVDMAAKETQDVVKETADARANYSNPTDPGDLAKRLRERTSGDAKHKAGSGGTNHDPAPVRIDKEPAKGAMPKPPNTGTT